MFPSTRIGLPPHKMLIRQGLCSFFGNEAVGPKGPKELRISTLSVEESVEPAFHGSVRGVEKINTDVDLLNSAKAKDERRFSIART